MSAESVRPRCYVPSRFASGTFPVSRGYHLRQMLYNYSRAPGRVDIKGPQDASNQAIMPSFPFSDVPVYADTVDMETLAFHDFWGCLLTPDNVAARACTDDLRYHAWVAAKRVVESGLINPADNETLLRTATNQFMVELGLALLDLCPGPLVLFVDPRLHDDPTRMVSSAMALVAKFDAAHVRRWRILITVPATEAGIWAANELTYRHGVQTHLALVSCLPHAVACIDAGARVVSMSVESIMEWFEQHRGQGDAPTLKDHPGIQAIQACAEFIDRRGLNTTLLTTDVREWAELKALSGIGATALKKEQLDQIPMRRLVTWYPAPVDRPPSALCAPTKVDLDSNPGQNKRMGVLTSLPAESRSLVAAVLYVRLRKMAACMDTIDRVVWGEVHRRIRLETVPLERLYRRPSSFFVAETRGRTGRSILRARETARREERLKEAMVEGVDYF